MEEKEAKFAELVGKTILDIQGLEKGSDEVVFVCSDGSKYKMYHSQDCCECVDIDDVIGDVEDLIGSKIIIAEENSNSEGNPKDEYDYSFTWTFYKLATKKGYVDIRWYGTSNGYYSESVDFVKIKEEKVYEPINTVVDFELTEEGKAFFEKEAQIAEDVRKIVGEQEKRLAALLYLIYVEQKIKPSDLMLCIEHPRIVEGQTVVKMYFKKRS